MIEKKCELLSDWDFNNNLSLHTTLSGISLKIEINDTNEAQSLNFSPQQLFIASICSCLLNALISKAGHAGIQLKDVHCKTVGVFETIMGVCRIDQIVLKPMITVNNQALIPKVLSLLENARHSSTVLNAIGCSIIITPQIIVKENP